jgi:rRNA-processing protein FCF1
MSNRYVIDSVGFINYHNDFFSERDMLSPGVRDIIAKCFNPYIPQYKLIIPSVIFIEVYKKFLRHEERARRFYYEVYQPISESVDIEIKPIEKEVLEIFSSIDADSTLELHDQIVYSTALQLECPLITNDRKIIYANKSSNKLSILF